MKQVRLHRKPFGTAVACALFAVLPVTRAETFVVTSTGDGGPGTLRRAISDAARGDEIRFDPSLDGRPILLSRGELVIDKPLIITGRGPANTIVDGTGRDRVLLVECCFNAITISGMTFRGGRSSWIGGCVMNERYTALTLNNIAVSGCTGDYGGGICNAGTLTLSNSAVTANEARYGGGIYNSSVLIMFNTTIHGNAASSGGGGIFNEATSWLSNITIHGNSAVGSGGGFFNWNGAASMSSTTISNNSAFDGGGIDAVQGEVTLENSIIAMQSRGGDCSSFANAIRSLGHSMDSDGSCNLNWPTDLAATDPMLEAIADNGGPTPTCALRIGSPAIDAGGDRCAPTDQRGEPRPRDGDHDGVASCDLGAFEVRRPTVDVPDDEATVEQTTSD